MMTTGKILEYRDGKLLVQPVGNLDRLFDLRHPQTVELRINDGRTISVQQRKKIFAIIRDISLWSGHEPEYLRGMLTWDFCAKAELEVFSLSDVDMSTARQFIDYLIDFCFSFGVPTKESLLARTDDIGKYLYLCLEHRRCAVCNAPAEVHHVDRIGMGRDRERIVHVGLRAIALCPKHHEEAHRGEKEFFRRYHIYGIPLDEHLCEQLGLRRKPKK